MSDRETRALANELARLRRRLDRFETTQQSWARSVEEAAVDYYDENDLLRLSVGRQADGSYGVRYPEGEAPPKPSEPDVVTVADGLVVVSWDGRFEERFTAAEFRNLRVHIDEGDPAFVPTRDNQVGAIWARRGGSIVAVTESDVDNPVYVKFVATNLAGQWSPESDAVLVDEADDESLAEEEEQLEWEDDDGHTLTAADIAAGSVTFKLTHDPEPESMLAWWLSTPQPPTAYSVNFTDSTVTWPLSGFEKAGQRLRVYYAYQSGSLRLVEFGDSGWRYKQVALDDTVDRSAPGFDDSGWAVGSAPFGNGTFGGHPAPQTPWAAQSKMWCRREITVPASSTVATVDFRVDNYLSLYLDGVLVFGPTGVEGAPADAEGAGTFVIEPGTHTLAMLLVDDTTLYTGDGTYGDVRVAAL